MSEKPESKSKRPWRGDAYWQYEMRLLLLEHGAAAVPDLVSNDGESGKKLMIAARLRLKYVVRRVHGIRKIYVGRHLDERVHDLLDQARLQVESEYWQEVSHEYHVRGVFML